MTKLASKHILIGVSGSIAAYKVPHLTRLLVKQGADVQIIMTPGAHDFVTPVTLATVSRHPVLTAFADNKSGQWHNHVELGQWADLLLIAPASANTIAKMANGICDNLLLATYLSAKCKTCFAPAMDLDMYKHPAVTGNIEKLTTYGNILIPAETGELASGLYGQGRMAEPEHICDFIQTIL